MAADLTSLAVDPSIATAGIADATAPHLGIDAAATRAGRLDAELAGLDALELGGEARRPLLARFWSGLWPKLAAVVLAVVIWQVVVWTHWRPEYALPGPKRVLDQLRIDVTKGSFYKAIGITMTRALRGFALAVVIGSLVGAAVSRVRVVRTAVGSLITGLQTMPSIVWFPLAILLFKLSEGAIMFVVVLGAAPSIANGLISGVDHVPPLFVRAGRTMGAGPVALFRHVVLPASLPSFLGGLKQGWAFAWRSLMAGELLVTFGKPSIGARLDTARNLSDAPALIATMVVVLAIGIAVDSVFGVADRGLRSRRGLLARA
jgi:NitT/TauT family transport system permease protein